MSVRIAVALLLWVCFARPAQRPVIGVVTARGGFWADEAKVSGNATIFEGTVIESFDVPCRLELKSGPEALLGPNSQVSVLSNLLKLEKGVVQLDKGDLPGGLHYAVEARGLRIVLVSPRTSAQVTLGEGGTVRVAATDGTVQVLTSTAELIANVAADRVLTLQPPQPGAEPGYSFSGCLEKRNGQYVVNHAASGVLWEVQGPDLEREVGYFVELSGSLVRDAKPAIGARLIRVQKIERIGGCQQGQLFVAESPKATATETAKPVPAARERGARRAVIAGVALAGTAAGVSAIVLMEKDKEPLSR